MEPANRPNGVDARLLSADHREMRRSLLWLAALALGVLVWALATDRLGPVSAFLHDSPKQLIPVDRSGE